MYTYVSDTHARVQMRDAGLDAAVTVSLSTTGSDTDRCVTAVGAPGGRMGIYRRGARTVTKSLRGETAKLQREVGCEVRSSSV